MNKILMKMFSMVLLGAMFLNTAYAAQSGSRIQAVEKLLVTSSAAKQIRGSNNHEAKEKHEQAVTILGKARQAENKGDEQQAADLLKQAIKIMFEATRMIEKDKSSIAKDAQEFDSLKASVDALMDAYINIRKEKGIDSVQENELYPFVSTRVEQAVALKQDNRVEEGHKLLDEAYVAAKVAIEHLRGGETLVHTLNFANSEEEYYYEVDRNDTHRMLVDVLLKEKMSKNSSARAMVNKYLAKANALRAAAITQASDGKYENAITILEQSTKEIVRAIRSAGIYIPG